MTTHMLSELTVQLDQLMEQYLKDSFMAGASFLIQKNGETLVSLQKGFADIQTGRPIMPDSLFHLYSMTKPIVAVAVMLLVERGQLDLFAPVSQYLEGFRNQRVILPGTDQTVPVKRECNIRDLLSMSSGLPYADQPDEAGMAAAKVFEEVDRRLYTDSPMSGLEIANALGQCPLSFHPGERWMYGTSADILGVIIEQITGVSLEEFLKEEIFLPLAMMDTSFDVPHEKQNRFVKSYLPSENGLTESPTNFLGIRYCSCGRPPFQSGGAGLISTIEDYGRFANMLNQMGTVNGQRILLPQTVRFLTQPGLNPAQQNSFWNAMPHLNGYSYGNLMRIQQYPGMSMFNSIPGEYGWAGWIGNLFANVPDQKLTLIYMMQKPGAGTSTLARKMFNLSYAYCLE